MLLFGNRFSQLSPFKIAQMAAWLAQLNGGGGGVIGEVRNTLGVDNVDVTTDETGAAAVGVGTYVGENIYTDVTVNARGETELNLNLDINESLTARGSVDYKGNGGIGLFFDRNY
jgi:translocation and assembly module TamB